MLNLRERLNRASPELHASLMRSWQIAQQEWIPAIKTSQGSFNSYPHFRNIEYHLDDLLAIDHPVTPIVLTPLELYLLLASVLFHDFGRVYAETKEKKHPEYSAEKLPILFSELGIPSLEMALSLARIALFHDPPKGKSAQVRRSLRSVRIEPYGAAREPFVATLLAVADHMDGSTRRAVPRYLDDGHLVGFKGAFRRAVSGTGYDRATCTIKTTMIGFEKDVLQDSEFSNYTHFETKSHEKSEYDVSRPHSCPHFEV